MSNRAAMLTPSPFTFHNDIAQINTNAKVHLPMVGQFIVFDFYCLLNLNGTAHGVNYTGELSQEVIARGIDDTVMVLVDQGRNEGTIGGEGTDGGFFIIAHKATVASQIRAKDRC